MEITIKGRKDLRLPVLVGCCQLCLLSSQIAGFFDHQYLWKESMNTKDFLLGGNQQLKEGWGYHFCLGLANCVYHSNRLQNSLIINISAWNQLILYFFIHGDNHQRKEGSETASFSWVLPVVPLVQSDSRILWSSISLEGINQNPRFFVWR